MLAALAQLLCRSATEQMVAAVLIMHQWPTDQLCGAVHAAGAESRLCALCVCSGAFTEPEQTISKLSPFSGPTLIKALHGGGVKDNPVPPSHAVS
jgi:hypothetical protein